MGDYGWRISDLLFQLHLKQERIHALESGEEFVRMKKQHQKELADQDKIIKNLQQSNVEKDRKITENRKMWEQVHDDIMDEHKRQLDEKDQIIAEREERIQKLEQQLEAERAKTKEAKEEMYKAQAELADAKEQIAALQANLNKDFTNSSVPSSQSPNHKTIHNGRKKSGRKQGAQPGHDHHGRKRQENAHEVKLPVPKIVRKNPGRYKLTGNVIRKQVISAKLVVTATDYVADEYLDTLTGKTFHAQFPMGVVDDVEYDSSIKAMAFLLNVECGVSIGKVKQFLSDISHGALDISTGAVCNFVNEFSRKSKEDRDDIIKQILASGVIHADFTFGRKQGRTSTVLIMTNNNSAAYVSVSAKGNAGVKEGGLDVFSGTLVSDHEAAFTALNCRRQECMAHTLRYGIGSAENEANLTWNQLFIDWNRRANVHWRTYDPNHAEEWKAGSEKLIQEFYTILQKAQQEYEYEPPSKYYMEGFNLYYRMAISPDEYILFLRDPSVAPTNNVAERLGRVYKRKAHQVMCFRGAHGEEFCCDGLTIIETAKMQGRNVYDEVTGTYDILDVRQRKRLPKMTTLQKMKQQLSSPEYWSQLNEP